jgi:pyroglutamyl-peptidase
MTIRVLATGFSIFPGAPHNPSEWLINSLIGEKPDLGPDVQLEAEVLPVDYRKVTDRLDELGRAGSPDIAVHFGLARNARGFRLERRARNVVSTHTADCAGYTPGDPRVGAGPAALPATLPLRTIYSELRARGLPVQYSSNAGRYLCNYTFYRSCSGQGGFRAGMAGFIHLPYLDRQLALLGETGAGPLLASLTEKMLRQGATLILQSCVDAWRQNREGFRDRDSGSGTHALHSRTLTLAES